MKKIITIILVLISLASKAQIPAPVGYLPQPAKWKMGTPLWLYQGAWISNLQAITGDTVIGWNPYTHKMGYKIITNSTVDTSHFLHGSDTVKLRRDINLKLEIADTAGMLLKYLRAADTLKLSNRINLKQDIITAGNGLIKGGSTLYVDTLKIASRRTPIFLTNITTPLIIGGTSTTSSLTYKTTTGVGTTGADHIFQVGNNGSIEAMRITNGVKVGIGTSSPSYGLHYKNATNDFNTNTICAENLSAGNAAGAQIFVTNNLGKYVQNAIYGSAYSGTTFGIANANLAEMTASADNVVYGSRSNNNVHFISNSLNRMTLFNSGNLTIGAKTDISKLAIPVAPTATANYGTFSLSNTTTSFNGSTNGYFVGAPAGQYIAVNSVGSVAYNFLQFSKNGSSRFKVDSLGYVKGGNLYSNSYTPTLTGVTNVSSSQAYTCQYSRVDSVVTVSGTIGITATSNNARTTIGISLPVASNFTAISNAGGAGYTTANTTAGHGAGIYADATNDRVELDYYETHGTADIFTFSFTYRIK